MKTSRALPKVREHLYFWWSLVNISTNMSNNPCFFRSSWVTNGTFYHFVFNWHNSNSFFVFFNEYRFFYLYVVLARQIDFSIRNLNLMTSVLLHVCRYFVTFFLWQWLMVSIKTAILVSITMAASFLKVLQVLKTSKLNYNTIKIYKEMTVERNILIGFERFFTGIGLTGLLQ